MRKFTLVELLIVIAVIGILVSLIVPNFYRSREIALRVDCSSNLSQIGKTFISHYTKNRGKLPSFDWIQSERMKSAYMCKKDDDPKVMDFYDDGGNIIANVKYSYGFNLSASGNRATSVRGSFSDFIVSYDAGDLYSTWVEPKPGNKGGGNNDDGVDSDNPHHGDGSEDSDENGGGSNWKNAIGGISPDDADNWYYQNLKFRHLDTACQLYLDGSVKIISKLGSIENLIIWYDPETFGTK